ncbi:nucleotide exchange factor GrpE [Candidatus Micrarchaeota archaeon]|nr:nucleotide exchange factor GrpE [Candidatus Micrarchaeota archaeon]
MNEEEIQAKIEEATKWKATAAFYDNKYKEAEKQWSEEKNYFKQKTEVDSVKEFLPLYEDFSNALNSVSEEEKKIIEPLAKKFFTVMKNKGLVELSVQKGDEFDSNLMDALRIVDGEDNKVVEIVSKGFLFKEKLLRPAQVIVGKQNNKGEMK